MHIPEWIGIPCFNVEGKKQKWDREKERDSFLQQRNRYSDLLVTLFDKYYVDFRTFYQWLPTYGIKPSPLGKRDLAGLLSRARALVLWIRLCFVEELRFRKTRGLIITATTLFSLSFFLSLSLSLATTTISRYAMNRLPRWIDNERSCVDGTINRISSAPAKTRARIELANFIVRSSTFSSFARLCFEPGDSNLHDRLPRWSKYVRAAREQRLCRGFSLVRWKILHNLLFQSTGTRRALQIFRPIYSRSVRATWNFWKKKGERRLASDINIVQTDFFFVKIVYKAKSHLVNTEMNP